MKGLSITFKNHEQEPLFVKGDCWSDVEKRLEKHYQKLLSEKDEDVTYFNFLIIDSDFVRDYDAEISIHSQTKNDDSYTFTTNYKVDFSVVNTIVE